MGFAGTFRSWFGKKPKVKRIARAAVEVRNGIVDPYDHNPDVAGPNWYGEAGTKGIAVEMRTDPHVGQALETKSGPLRGARWVCEPASTEPIDREIADFVAWNLFERHNWDKSLTEICRSMENGFSLMEFIEEVSNLSETRFPNHPGKGIGILTRECTEVPAWTVNKWHHNKSDPKIIDAITQRLEYNDLESNDEKKISLASNTILRVTQRQDGDDPTGNPYLRLIYREWKIKKLLMVLDAIRHERHAVGIPHAEIHPDHPISDEDLDLLMETLSHLRADDAGSFVLPPGVKFTWGIVAGAADPTLIAQAISRCNKDIAHAFASGFMLLGLETDGGSYALSSTQQGQYTIQLAGDARHIANCLTFGCDGWSPVRRLVDMNYGPGYEAPKVVVRDMPTHDWLKTLPQLPGLVAADLVRPDDGLRAHIRNVAGLPKHDETSDAAAETRIPEVTQ